MADDYLKAIYHHTEWQDNPITPSQLAAVLSLAPSSVTEMVKKLAAQGLVTHRPYGPVSLTTAGGRRAAGVIRRHRLIETWLVREFGYSWDEVHDEAEVLEHSLSDRLLEGIDERLGRPRFDPTEMRSRMPTARCTANPSCSSPRRRPGTRVGSCA